MGTNSKNLLFENMKKIFGVVGVLVLVTCFSLHAQSQRQKPVSWHFTAIRTGDKEARLVFTASLDDGWHIYSQFLDEGGPLPTAFSFAQDDDYSLKGKVNEESVPVKIYDNTFMMDIVWFTKTAVFSQMIKLNAPSTVIKGKIEFMACTEDLCLPPEEVAFSVKVESNSGDTGFQQQD
jgi:thiol:disulfide interchange protein DsbD